MSLQNERTHSPSHRMGVRRWTFYNHVATSTSTKMVAHKMPNTNATQTIPSDSPSTPTGPPATNNLDPHAPTLLDTGGSVFSDPFGTLSVPMVSTISLHIPHSPLSPSSAPTSPLPSPSSPLMQGINILSPLPPSHPPSPNLSPMPSPHHLGPPSPVTLTYTSPMHSPLHIDNNHEYILTQDGAPPSITIQHINTLSPATLMIPNQRSTTFSPSLSSRTMSNTLSPTNFVSFSSSLSPMRSSMSPAVTYTSPRTTSFSLRSPNMSPNMSPNISPTVSPQVSPHASPSRSPHISPHASPSHISPTIQQDSLMPVISISAPDSPQPNRPISPSFTHAQLQQYNSMTSMMGGPIVTPMNMMGGELGDMMGNPISFGEAVELGEIGEMVVNAGDLLDDGRMGIDEIEASLSELIESPPEIVSGDSPEYLDDDGDNGRRRKTSVKGRSKKRKFSTESEDTICPICNAAITADQFTAHYALELSKLGDVPTISSDSTLSTSSSSITSPSSPQPLVSSPSSPRGRGKREAAVHARKKVHTQIQLLKPTKGKVRGGKPGIDHDEVLKAIRKNRQTRAQNRNLSSSSSSIKNDDTATPEKQTCFICGEGLHGDSEDINSHVDNCLASLNNNNSTNNSTTTTNNNKEKPKGKAGGRRGRSKGAPVAEEEFETYTIAGQKRIRASSFLDDNYALGMGMGGTVSKSSINDEDGEEDLNIDGDDTAQFGQIQFSESDLVSMEEPPFSPPITTTTTTSTTSSSSATTPHQPIVIESLKARVKELEQNAANSGHCMICLSWYEAPVVSIKCWHVHCEKCWMSTLATKKLCPQCNVITTPAELRRIFL